MTLWLLLICTSTVGYPCYTGGGVTSLLVTEKQCRAALTLRENKMNVTCIAPDGTLLTNSKP